MDATKGSILIDGNTAAALGCVYAGATVAAWYPITPSTSLMDAFAKYCAKYPPRPGDGAQQLPGPAGGGRAGRDRHGPRRIVGRGTRLHIDVRAGHLADAGAARHGLLRGDSSGGVRRAARRSIDGDADTRAAGGHPRLRLRVARRHQAHPAVPRAIPRSASRWRRPRSTLPSVSRRRCSCSPTSTSA